MAYLRNRDLRNDAGIDSFKLELSYADNAAFLTAMGPRAVASGDIYYDEALAALRRYTGSAYETLATPGGAGGLTLNDAYNAGRTITRDGTGSVAITDATADANASLALTRSAGTGAVISFANTGSGDDILGTGSLWSVNLSGQAIFARVRLGDDEAIQLGASQDGAITYVSASDEVRFTLAAAATQFVFGGADGTGYDVVFRGATAGANVTWDESVDDLILDGAARLVLGDSNALVFGDGDDVTIQWDATRFVLATAAADAEIRLGDGTTRTDVRVYGSTSATSALFDASANIIEVNGYDIRLQDEDYALFGDSSDVTMRWNAANSRFHVEVAADDTEIRVGDGTLSADVRIYGATAADFILFDASANTLTLTNIDLVLAGASAPSYADAVALTFGTGSDATIQWDGTTWNFEVSAADSQIRFGSATLRADIRWFGASGSDTADFDASASRIDLNGVDLRLQDSDILQFGDGSDIAFTWNGTNLVVSWVADDTGAINFGVSGGNSGDVAWFAGTNVATFNRGDSRLDLNGVDLRLQDADILQFGDASDVSITWDGTNLVIDPVADDTGAIHIGVSAATGMDFVWWSATGAGSVTFNAGAAAIVTSGVDLTITEADVINLGATTPITMTPAAGTVVVAAGAANDVWDFGEGTTNIDVRWFGSAATSFIRFDASDNDMLFDAVNIHLGDNDRIQFGDAASGDITVGWDAANLTVLWAVDDTGGIVLGASGGASGDVTWFAGTNSVLLDRGNSLLTLNGIDLELNDDDEVRFGDSDDVVIRWQAAGGLLVTGAAADSTFEIGASGVGNQFDLLIHFAGGDLSSDASGDVVALDGIDLRVEDTDLILLGDAGAGVSVGFVTGSSEVQVRAIAGTPRWDFDGVGVNINDADTLAFGDAQDVTVQWNGTNLVIAPVATDTGAILLGNNTVAPNHLNMDVLWTGGVSNTQTVRFDVGNIRVDFDDVDLRLGDNDVLQFGDAADITVTWNATNLVIDWAVNDTGAINFGVSGSTGGDVQWFTAAGAASVLLDAGNALVDANGVDIRLQDDDQLRFGDSDDVVITWALAGGLGITGAAADTAISVGAAGAGNQFDLTWFTTGGTINLDASASRADFVGTDLRMGDDDILSFGLVDDVTMRWTNASTRLDVLTAADNTPIYFGDGTTNFDLRVYGSAVGNYIVFDNDAGTGATGLLDLTNNIMLAVFSNAPSSATATGTAGEITWAAGFLYVCVATNTWQRAALSTW